MKILASGVGNELKGDDAFGVKAAGELDRDTRLPAEVTVLQTGIGGIHLVQELMRGYDMVLLFDAVDRKDSPGKLFLLEPELPQINDLTDLERRDFFADTHYATPIRALTFAREIKALPKHVRIIGCQPVNADTFGTNMNQVVRDAIPLAVDMALDEINALLQSQTGKQSDFSR